eukprot:scaffold53193_cov35-Tisochrysis_lutea.AAC.1
MLPRLAEPPRLLLRLMRHVLLIGSPVSSQVTKDSARTKYLEPDEALAYGIVDKVRCSRCSQLCPFAVRYAYGIVDKRKRLWVSLPQRPRSLGSLPHSLAVECPLLAALALRLCASPSGPTTRYFARRMTCLKSRPSWQHCNRVNPRTGRAFRELHLVRATL